MRRPQVFRVGVSDRMACYADAIRVPAHTVQVMTSGVPGLTPTGAIPDTFEAEARQAWMNVRKVLLAAGACLTDVISVRAWLTGPADIPTYTQVYDRFIHTEPVVSLVVVDQLTRPAMRVQVDVVAALPAGDT